MAPTSQLETSSSLPSSSATFCPSLGLKQLCPEEQSCCEKSRPCRGRQFPGHKSAGSFHFKNLNFHFEFDSEPREESTKYLGDIFREAGVAERQGGCLFQFWKFHFLDPFILSVFRPDAFIRHSNMLAPAPHCSPAALNYCLN